MEFVIAVAALLLATWAVVEARKARHDAREAKADAVFGPGGGETQEKLSDLEHKIGAWALLWHELLEARCTHNARLSELERLQNERLIEEATPEVPLGERVEVLERRVERVEEGFIVATAPLSVYPPPLLRTPPGDGREVREITTDGED